MKVSGHLLGFLAIYLWQLPASADQAAFSITSPDRPAVWYNRTGDKIGQYLDWSNAKNQLVLHLAYNLGNSTSYERDQTWIDNFELSFPNVHLNRSNNRLYFVGEHGREITIGHLEPGIAGTRVVLDNAELSAHRRNGVVEAAIKSVSSPSR
jgi:hypothetical protein